VDTAAIEPTAQILSHQNVTRPDESRPSWPPEDILSNAAAVEEGFIRVPAVLDDAREEPAPASQSSGEAGRG
jgi:aspartyl/glutamyl-tRNA(Asn/Gln) amidotransferase C subunit